MTTKQQTADFKKQNPVGQNHHTGKWGWRRVCDCLNLSKCVFDSKRAAEMDRAAAAIAAAERGA